MAIQISFRSSEFLISIIDSMVEKGIFRSRSRAIELLLYESLNNRGLIDYKDV